MPVSITQDQTNHFLRTFQLITKSDPLCPYSIPFPLPDALMQTLKASH